MNAGAGCGQPVAGDPSTRTRSTSITRIITAPIDGIVTQRSVDVGQTVAASMQAPTLFIIAADLTKMQVNANIDEADVGRIRPGQHVTFRVDAYPGRQFEGTVAQVRLQPVVVQNVTTYGTIINVPNPRSEAEAGHDGEPQACRSRGGPTCCACRTPRCGSGRRPTCSRRSISRCRLKRSGGGRGADGRRRRTTRAAARRHTPEAGATRARRGAAPTAAPAAAASGRPTAPARRARRRRRASGRSAARKPAAQPGATAARRRWRAGGQAAAIGASVARACSSVSRRMSPDEQTAVHRAHEGPRRRHQRVRGGDAGRQGAGGKAPAASTTRRSTAPRRPAQTIDALFAPLPTVESPGRAWLYVDKQLKPVSLRLGITDGTNTELSSGELQPDTRGRHRRRAAVGATRTQPPPAARGQSADAARRRAAGGAGSARCRSVISVKNLVKTYVVGEVEVSALRGVNLDVERGEFLAVTGPSGSGKSTFMHIIGCLDRPTSGQYFLDGQDVSRMSKDQLAAVRNKKIGFVFQGFNLLSRTSALDNVELPLLYGGDALKAAERHKRAMEVLDAVGLGQPDGSSSEPALRRSAAARRDRPRADQQPVDSAGGRADREPRHAHQHRSDGHLPAAERERGITVLLITHEMDIAEYGTRIVTFRDGQVVARQAGRDGGGSRRTNWRRCPRPSSRCKESACPS